MKNKLLECTIEFTEFLSRLERSFQRYGRTIPNEDELTSTAHKFWKMSDRLESIVAETNNEKELKSILLSSVGPWLFRSLPFNRSYHKPFGYSGDYSIVELMYDLEHQAGKCHYLSGITNCLDYCFSTIHSVQSIWERRRFLASALRNYQQGRKIYRVLDIACGGSRYHRDFLDSTAHTGNIELTLLDQDPAAINFTKYKQLVDYSHLLRTINIPISRIKTALQPGDGKYDVIISAGLFDYLNQKSAKNLILHLESLLNDNGIILITNYSTDDRSAFVKEWFADWNLIFRNKSDMESIFSNAGKLSLSFSKNNSLIFATYTK